MKRAIIALAFACSPAARPPAFHLSIGNSGASLADGGQAAVFTMESDATRVLELFVVGETSGPVMFAAHNLPSFATLQSSFLTLAPRRADAGGYEFVLSASSGSVTESVPIQLVVHRANSPPQWLGFGNAPWSLSLGDDLTPSFSTSRYPVCPGSTCTLSGTGKVKVTAKDPDGDRVIVEVEVVPRGATFSTVATHSGSGLPDAYQTAHVEVPLAGLSPNQSYDFAVRISDEFGAIAEVPGSADGWYHPALYQFDQGPCTTRTCACAPVDAGCQVAIDCCSGTCAPDYVRMWSYCK